MATESSVVDHLHTEHDSTLDFMSDEEHQELGCHKAALTDNIIQVNYKLGKQVQRMVFCDQMMSRQGDQQKILDQMHLSRSQ